MFMKATTVAILLAPGFDCADRTDDSTTAYHQHREQLRELLRDLASFLQRTHAEGAASHAYAHGGALGSARKLVFGLGVLVTADPALVEPALPAVLLEGTELGMLGLTREEARAIEGMRAVCVAARDAAATSAAAARRAPSPSPLAHG